MIKTIKPVIFTNKANCRDCYKCLRQCDVKAIRMIDSQAEIDQNSCINCGRCIEVCPQDAKEYRDDTLLVREMLKTDKQVIASLAPSYKAVFPESKVKRIPSFLRTAGFSFVAETADAAYNVVLDSVTTFLSEKKSIISSSCPVVVDLIRKHYPHLKGYLAPVVSPVIAQARAIKSVFPDAKIVFIGPCIAKKNEIRDNDLNNEVDAVITFQELKDIIQNDGYDLDLLEESECDLIAGKENLSFCSFQDNHIVENLIGADLKNKVIKVSGKEAIFELLDNFKDLTEKVYIDALYCYGGCISGPSMIGEYKSLFSRRRNILKNSRYKNDNDLVIEYKSLNRDFSDISVEKESFSEDQILEVLKKTGKSRQEDILDCSACGYDCCRDKAIAVLRGDAPESICIPWMRKLAKQTSDKVLETSPNGIVIVSSKLEIQNINKAFKKMFICTDSILGRDISQVIDAEYFEKFSCSDKDIIRLEREYKQYSKYFHIILYRMIETNNIVGIYVDITENRNSNIRLSDIRRKSIIKSRELLDHQIKISQELAEFLGESTAKSEKLIDDLINSIER